MPVAKAVKLTLAPWQQRMVADHLKLPVEEVTKVTIPIIDKRQWVMYRQPVRADLLKGAWNLYLTDTQIKKVAAALGADVKISALRISREMVRSGGIRFE